MPKEIVLVACVALTPLKYRGQRVAEGAGFEADEDDVEDLLKDSLIAIGVDSVPEQDGVTMANQRILDVTDAINSLDEKDPALWTKDKKPKTEAIEAVDSIDFEVSAALRDEAWSHLNEYRQ